jgi:hypothetical protein
VVIKDGDMNKPTNQTPSVANAEQMLARFERERAELIERKAALADKRKAVAYDAHAAGNTKLLDGVHREAAELDSRIAGLDDAVAEAQRRLQQAHEHEARFADRNQALELRAHLVMFLETARALDEALAAVAAHGNKLHELQAQMHRCGAAVPNPAQLDSLGARSLLTACAATPWRRHFETLAPHERRSFAALCAQWGQNIQRGISARLGEEQTTIEAAE